MNATTFSFAVVLKFEPEMVTVAPAAPLVGVKLLMLGTPLDAVTVKDRVLVAEPPGAVTATVPVVAPEGTVTTTRVAVVELTVAEVPYESFLDVSATRRDTFELHLSRTHLAFGMPSFGHQWVDTEIAPLSWASGVVQLGHHTYNPTKGTGGNSGGGPGAGAPNTWHWDNVHISPAFPFTLLAGDRRVINETTSPEVAFPGASPDGAHLRFMGIGDDLQVSFDRGATWQPAVKQRMRKEADEHFKSCWTPIPTEMDRVMFRGSDAWFGPWMVRDISIWAL